MDRGWMRTCCPGARPHGPAVLERYRFLFNTRGEPTVAPASEGRVYGLAWRLGEADLAALDRYEGLAQGDYTRRMVDVVTASGTSRAWIYIASDTRPGPPHSPFLERVVGAARAAGLPEQYIREIATMRGDASGRRGQDQPRRLARPDPMVRRRPGP